MAERQQEISKMFRNEIRDDQFLGASGGNDLRNSKSPEKVAQNELFELLETIKDLVMHLKVHLSPVTLKAYHLTQGLSFQV